MELSLITIVGIVILYWVSIEILKKRGILEKRNITAIGPILMIRSVRVLNLLDRFSRPKKFWKITSTLGILVTFIGMFFMLSLIILMDIVLLTSPPKPSALTHPRNILLIPGINEFIPLVWGIIGLIVTLVVHEFSHAVICRVENVRVKSLGVLFALIPIGGFAEPNEEDIKKVSVMQRLRIYSAGIMSNFIVALIAFLMFIHLLGYLTPHIVVVKSNIVENGSVIVSVNGVKVHNQEELDKVLKLANEKVVIEIRYKNGTIEKLELNKIAGVYVTGIWKGYPAEEAGLRKGMVIVKVNNVETPTLKSFIEVMKSTKPNQTIKVYAYDGEKIRIFNVTLVRAPSNGHGFMGVYIGGDYLSGMILGYSDQILISLQSLPSNLMHVNGWLSLIAMPLLFRGFGKEITNYFTPTDFWKNYGELLFYILNTLYWIGWFNFYIGLFNCLPAIPLDGGRMLRDLLSFLFSETVSATIVKLLTTIILLSIIMSVLIPNLKLI
ncbi:MAG TPA: PDZ domain-containing protein [Archaeoglobus profundus]|nr:PDZ domain-containing protein [Archaeoglobus profundus]